MTPSTSEGRRSWTSPERTAVLRREADVQSVASREETDALLKLAEIRPGHRVLDVACGPGDPSLEVARRVGPSGQVVGIDISGGALEVAQERAQRHGVANLRFETADAEDLPLGDASVDRVVCRFGAMFFEDLPKSAREMRRVLVNGGRVALMVWGSFDQPYIQGTVGVLLRHLHLTAPPGDTGRPFRFADPSELIRALDGAGFAKVRAASPTVHWIWKGDPASARDNWRQGLVFWRSLVDQLPGGDRSPAWQEILENFRRYERDGEIRVPLAVHVITADRP
jgi:SAM-dependent methyltransferase